MRHNAPSSEEASMSTQDSKGLWDRWIELWNGDVGLAAETIHPDFAVHRVPAPHVPEGLGGREALLAWIKATRSFFDDLRFTVEVGPVVDGETVAGRWVAEGAYQ